MVSVIIHGQARRVINTLSEGLRTTLTLSDNKPTAVVKLQPKSACNTIDTKTSQYVYTTKGFIFL